MATLGRTSRVAAPALFPVLTGVGLALAHGGSGWPLEWAAWCDRLARAAAAPLLVVARLTAR